MTALAPLFTPWGETLDADRPLPEYPRPQFVRDSYSSLNGRWQYAITATDEPPLRFDGELIVPFSPEALLSGVGRQLRPDQVLHYRRSFRLPEGFRRRAEDRVLLHFGAVDQECRVSVNGAAVGGHTGGYLPFRFDVTDVLREGDNDLAVLVRDPSDTGPLSRGKQRLHRGGIWYTAQSGIWQTVWLEAVPPTWIEAVTLTPDLPGAAVEVVVRTQASGRSAAEPVEPPALRQAQGPQRAAQGPQRGTQGPEEAGQGTASAAEGSAPEVDVTVVAGREVVARMRGRAGEPIRLGIPEPHPWSPEDPYLYQVHVSCGDDTVRAYVGMRSLGIAPNGDGHPRLLLNGEPYFAAGVLDQGYWPDGLYTAPSDEAMIHDITMAKRLGFTMIRKHIKVEPLRWYFHCDRLGILVWQDMVNGGHPYSSAVITAPAVLPVRLDDSRYERFGRTDTAARRHWLAECEDTVALLRNSPSVVAWVPFNEGWGQFDSAAVTRHLHELDPGRPVDAASGWHDQGAGEFDSRHVYIRPFRPGRRRGEHRVLALTEYGGYSRHLPRHSSSSRAFGYRRFGTEQALHRALRRLHDRQIVPAIEAGLSATVYTQLTDVEDETNGLMTADRRVLKLPLPWLRTMFARLRLSEP